MYFLIKFVYIAWTNQLVSTQLKKVSTSQESGLCYTSMSYIIRFLAGASPNPLSDPLMAMGQTINTTSHTAFDSRVKDKALLARLLVQRFQLVLVPGRSAKSMMVGRNVVSCLELYLQLEPSYWREYPSTMPSVLTWLILSMMPKIAASTLPVLSMILRLQRSRMWRCWKIFKDINIIMAMQVYTYIE